MTEDIKRMHFLVDQLNQWTKSYDEGRPEVSDKTYDEYYFELKNLENKINVVLSNSPTRVINYEVVNSLEKVTHNHPLLSLDKTKSVDEILKFIKGKDCCMMPKMDGLTLSVRYIDGKIVSLETRGNGEIGENVTHNAQAISNLPLTIPYKDELIIDGEAIIDYKTFNEKFAEDYANPRNLVSGSIRLLDSAEAAKRNIQFVAWKVYKGYDECETYAEKLDKIRNECGFTTVSITHLCAEDNLKNKIDEIRSWCTDVLNYPIDGMVFGVNNIKEAAAMGEATAHHVQYQMAFKFYDEEYETYLRDIVYDVSRQGIMTPVAVFDDVDTGDSIINRASLHNISVMKDILGTPYEGQLIKICKFNMIIPGVCNAKNIDGSWRK